MTEFLLFISFFNNQNITIIKQPGLGGVVVMGIASAIGMPSPASSRETNFWSGAHRLGWNYIDQ